MRIEPADRRPPVGIPWIVGLVFYLGLLTVVHLINVTRGTNVLICPLRRTTGLPCPTCGSTRAGFALLSLDPLAALAFNPVVTVLLILFVAWLILRVVFARRVVLELDGRGRRLAWIGLIVLFALNWVWVLHVHGFF